MLVREAMMTDVPLIAPETTVDVAAQIMADLDIGALPVGADDRTLAGIITGRDILVRVVATRRDPRTTPVGEAMSSELLCCHGEDDAAQALRDMERRQIRRMPVLDGEGHMIGLVTAGDLAAPLLEAAGDKPRRS